MRIETIKIGEGCNCFIIAEAGVNHNGSLELARKLVDVAANAGADAVKFQTYKTEDLILTHIEKASYQKVTTSAEETQTQMLKRLEIDREFHCEIIKHCATRKILFLSTCYEEASLNLLGELNVPVIKIASTDTTNLLFLEKVARMGKPVILSTGMSSLAEVRQAYQCLRDGGCFEIALLKCTSNYPTALIEVNLRGIATLRENFDAIIGFSDHTEGIGASPYAVALGAKIIEKHFTLDKSLPGPDHRASLSPQELELWVREIRRVEQMLGGSEIGPTESERGNRKFLQKSLVTRIRLRKGDVITRDNVVAKRTGGIGISAGDVLRVLGLTLSCDVEQDHPVETSYLESASHE